MSHRVALRTIVALVTSIVCACGGDPTESPTAPTVLRGLNLERVSTSASSDGIQGASLRGQAPAPNGGPRITASGNQRVINGGTLLVTINGESPFTTIYVFAGGKTAGLTVEGTGTIDGYYQIALGAPQTTATVLLTFPQDILLEEFDLLFAVASSAGLVGPAERLSTTVTAVGTGDVQITLSWDANSDVDLHVVTPGGEEIYYAHRSSATGGELDLDSNAECVIDGVRNENIRWPVGRAPRGPYIVRVDYWSACDVARTNYTVRVINGNTAELFSGFFTGPGDHGGAGSGRTITTVDRVTGPTALTSLLSGLPSATINRKASTSRVTQ
ncbi:MAG TPA: hypothetical protein VJM31_07775 [Vicinamibacterales bacterium]|nr:hypothetical protein [Vicinamibacterales bacterium]